MCMALGGKTGGIRKQFHSCLFLITSKIHAALALREPGRMFSDIGKHSAGHGLDMSCCRFKGSQLCESLLRACVYAQPTIYAALAR
jgi:hypothetical protein